MIDESPSTSCRQLASQLEVSRETARKIMKKDLSLFPYKIQTIQQLNELQ
ncbi:hypothetical protein X777_08645 [Ooceraea biroi]|uniref:Uncharacterized protein n=1 Tax=Ooceraea biroi TaxID=2015173 RepID=A0A026WBP8_OOCBI|nr:hypothetical protein X777_08645 [Ooceraea biroi]